MTSVAAPVAAGWATKNVDWPIPARSGRLALVLRVGNTARTAEHYSVRAARAAPGTRGAPPQASNGFAFRACRRLAAGAAPEDLEDCPSLRVTAVTFAADRRLIGG